MHSILHKIIVLMCCSGSVFSHDFWLETDNFNPNSNDKVEIFISIGEDFTGERLPRIPQWFLRFDAFDGVHTTPVKGILGDDPAGAITIKNNNLKIINYQSDTTLTITPAKKFTTYLQTENAQHVIDFRKANNLQHSDAAEYFSRYAKLLINPVNNISAYTKQFTGLKLEITPTHSPFVDSNNQFVVTLDGAPLPQATVMAYSKENPNNVLRNISNNQGIVEFDLAQNNIWMIRTVYIQKTTGEKSKHANWESFWSSLVFKK